MRSMLLAPLALALGCAPVESVDSASSALVTGEMIVYQAGHEVPQSDLTDLGDPAALGGTVLEGDPHISARVDYAEGTLLGGVFQATTGKVLIHFPFTEHATILEGKVALTDEQGNHRVLKPGDSYFIKQGSNIVWDVKGERVQKSFFNRVEAADAPGPMIVYEKGSVVAGVELVDLGDPAGLGGTVLEGDPHISARVDFAGGGLLGGVFQATKGKVLIDFPFTEHATITRGKVTLTDETGATHRFEPGDAYLIKQGSHIVWDVKNHRVQKSFLNFTAP